MSNRTLVSLVVVLITVFLIVKLDVFTEVKMNVTNWIYGEEMKNIKSFRVVVDPLIPELEKAGLTREAIRQEIEAMLEKNGIRALNEEDWRKIPAKPFLNVTVDAMKADEGRYQYNVTISILKSEEERPGALAEKLKVIWLSSGIGEGDVLDIRARIAREMGLFLEAREN